MTRSTCGPYANPTVGGLTAAFGHRPGRCRRLQDTYTPADHCCLNGRACRHALPSAAPPSTEERNDVSADVILAKELKGLIRWRHAFVNIRIESCLACCHAKLIMRAARDSLHPRSGCKPTYTVSAIPPESPKHGRRRQTERLSEVLLESREHDLLHSDSSG